MVRSYVPVNNSCTDGVTILTGTILAEAPMFFETYNYGCRRRVSKFELFAGLKTAHEAQDLGSNLKWATSRQPLARCPRARVARGGAYTFGGGKDLRTGSGLSLAIEIMHTCDASRFHPFSRYEAHIHETAL